MESVKIYEESYKELTRINKETSTGEIKIDLSKLDTETKGQMLTAIRNVTNQRQKDIGKIIFGVQN